MNYSPATGAPPVRASLLYALSWGLAMLLLVQNALGFYVNLFAPLAAPTGYDGVFPEAFGTPVLAAHVVVAFVLLGILVAILTLARSPGDRRLRGPAALGIAALVVAAYSGYHFIASQENVYSYSMELGFLVVVACSVLLVVWSRPAASPGARGTVDPAVSPSPLGSAGGADGSSE